MKRLVPTSRPARTRVLAAITAVACLFTLTACGSGSSASGSSTKGIQLKVGEFSWTAASIETQIIAAIAKAHPDLGVSSVKAVKVDPAPGWVGLKRGDLDVLPEVNLPNQQTFADQAKSTTTLLSETYGGATQGWFVPKYLVATGGAAEGLTSISQLSQKKWADKVGGTLYDADPGWVTTTENAARIKAFDLKLKHQTSSEAALIAQLKRAYERKQPILLYFYHPHWLFTKYDLVQLKEPKPYTSTCFIKGGPSDCAIPTLAAWIAARKDLATRAPKFYAALKNVSIPLADIESLLAKSENGTSASTLAQQWVSAHKSEVDQWVK